MTSVHTIAIPDGWSVEQTWEAIARGDKLPTGTRWASVLIENGRLIKVMA